MHAQKPCTVILIKGTVSTSKAESAFASFTIEAKNLLTFFTQDIFNIDWNF